MKNNRLFIAIKMKGYELEEFAGKCGWTLRYIQMIIDGDYKPKIETAQKILNKLNESEKGTALKLGLYDIFEPINLQLPGLDFLKKEKSK